jgi:hypothetical protein
VCVCVRARVRSYVMMFALRDQVVSAETHVTNLQSTEFEF